MALKPTPTTAPSAYGLQSYALQSSMTNPMASNYQAPMSVPNSTQLNAFGAPLYSNNAYNTTNRVANTNVSTGAIIPTPQPGPSPTQGTPPADTSGPSIEQLYRQQMEGQINSGYNDYFNSLDQMLGGLDTQRAAQEGIANTSYNTNLTDLGLSRDQNLADLQTQENKTNQNQVKTLKDISSNIRNLMNAGNTYLGAQGAGDSSAVNQYAYALTKLGSQQRGDVQSQTAGILADIGDRESRLNNVYMQEKNRLAGERDTQIQQVSLAFADAQRQLQEAKANGQLAKSQDLQSLTTNLYNQAVQQLANIQNQTQQRQSQLEQWAMNNSTSLTQLKQNLSQIGQFQAPNVTANKISNPLSMANTGGGVSKYGGSGSYTDEQKKLLGLA